MRKLVKKVQKQIYLFCIIGRLFSISKLWYWNRGIWILLKSLQRLEFPFFKIRKKTLAKNSPKTFWARVAAGVRNFNIQRGRAKLAITERRRGCTLQSPLLGQQHMLSLSLIKFLQCLARKPASTVLECDYCYVIAPEQWIFL